MIQVLGLKLVENFFCDIIPASLTCIKHSNKTSPQRRQIKDLLNTHVLLHFPRAQFNCSAFIGATHDKLKFGKGIFIGSIWTEEFQIYEYKYLTQGQFQTLN